MTTHETIPSFTDVETMNDAEIAAAEAGIELPADAPASTPAPVVTPAPETPVVPAPETTVPEPAKETPAPTTTESPPVDQPVTPDSLEEIRAQLARMEHDSAVYREALEQVLAGQVPTLQPKTPEKPDEIVFPTLEFTQEEIAEAQTSEAGMRAYSAKLAQHNLDVAAAVEQKMLRNIQSVIPKVITDAVQNEITRRENIAKGNDWETQHPEFAGEIPRVTQIAARERAAHPDWSVDKLLQELGPIASKELRIPLIKRSSTPAETPPSPVAIPGARPLPVATKKLTGEQQDVLSLHAVLGSDQG